MDPQQIHSIAEKWKTTRPPYPYAYTKVSVEDTQQSNGKISQWKQSCGYAGYVLYCLAFIACLNASFLWVSHQTKILERARCSKYGGSAASSSPSQAEIPNIVHFTHVFPGAENITNEGIHSESELPDLDFKRFLSVYSAHHYLNPDKIFIWTDEPSAAIFNSFSEIIDSNKPTELTKRTNLSAANFVDGKSKRPYIDALRRIPNLEIRVTDFPSASCRNVSIKEMAAKSDFVRVRVLAEYGGIYMDSDVYPIRSFDHLRRSGFRAVLGQQEGGDICGALMMFAKNSVLAKIFAELTDKVFDGSWGLHAFELLTSLTHDFGGRPGEVLVLSKRAFFEGGWGAKSYIDLYGPSTGFEKDGSNFCRSPLFANLENNTSAYIHQILDSGKVNKPPSFDHISFCEAYTVHGFDHNIKDYRNDAKVWNKMFPKHDGITLDYVIEQGSTFARATFPALDGALKSGVLKSCDVMEDKENAKSERKL